MMLENSSISTDVYFYTARINMIGRNTILNEILKEI